MKFAITYFSPVHPEMEICRRIERASQNLGIECYFVGQDGYVLQNKKHITEIKPDFLIVFDPAHLTLFDVFTYHLLWFVPGLVNTQHAIFYNALSINCDDRLGFPSEKAISYYNQFYGDINLNYLFPSVPKNYVLPPREFKSGETYKAFYAGINVDSKTVRHEKIFKYLDEKGLVNLYGPRQIEGKTNWKGFKAYRGEIKFDGHSLMETANASGITLALHHEVHASFSMPTNRLFEGIAAGTLVITDRMSFAEKEFKDCIFFIDFNLPEEKKAKEIEKIILWAQKNPEEAKRRIELAQKIFFEKYELTKVIEKLCDAHDKRKKELFRRSLSNCKHQKVTIVGEVYDLDSLETISENIFNQDYPYLEVLLVFYCSEDEKTQQIVEKIKNKFKVNLFSANFDRKFADDSGPNVYDFLRDNIKSEKFIYCVGLQFWHKNHVRSLVEKANLQNSLAVYSGLYFLNPDKTQTPLVIFPIRHLREKITACISTEQNTYYQSLHREFLKSSVLFDTSLLKSFTEPCSKFLIGYEHIALVISAFMKDNFVVFSEKLTAFLKTSPYQGEPEFQKELYYQPVRLNARMSFNSLQFVLNEAFAQNADFKRLVATTDFESPKVQETLPSYFDNYSYTRFKSKLKKCLLFLCGLVSLALLVAIYSIFFNE